MSSNGRRRDQPAWAYEMELALVREIQDVKETIPSDARVRELAREEMGIASRQAWNFRQVAIAAAMLIVALSTFVLVTLRGSGHG